VLATNANDDWALLALLSKKRDGAEVKKFSKISTKEMMTVSKAEPVRITGKPNSEEKRSVPFKDTIRRRPL